jgi:hypothetical protein
MCIIRQQKENINKMDYSCKRNNMKMSHNKVDYSCKRKNMKMSQNPMGPLTSP